MTAKIGLIVGKFLPFHKGHEYAINFASEQVDLLYVFVDSPHSDKPDIETRVKWIEQNQINNKIIVVGSSDFFGCAMPQDPSEHPDFWNIWRKRMFGINPRFDYLFASEEYGVKFAEVLGATFVPVDISREIIPISGTEIRKFPRVNFDFLTKEAKRHYRKKIVIAGPESVGKSTIVKEMATYYKTSYVPEYGRTFYEHRKEYKCLYEDMVPIAKGHAASIKAIEDSASGVLLIDTDAIATAIFSEFYHGKVPNEVIDIIQHEKVDLTILLAPDVPHVDDGQRDLQDERDEFFDRYIEYLEHYDRKYVIIEGVDFDERTADVAWAIHEEIVR